jgi:hypothetical protein
VLLLSSDGSPPTRDVGPSARCVRVTSSPGSVLEALVLKRVDEPYVAGQRRWRKLRYRETGRSPGRRRLRHPRAAGSADPRSLRPRPPGRTLRRRRRVAPEPCPVTRDRPVAASSRRQSRVAHRAGLGTQRSMGRTAALDRLGCTPPALVSVVVSVQLRPKAFIPVR